MNRRKYQKRFELAHRLRAVGVPLEIDVHDGESGLLMRQIGGGLESSAFSLKSGGTGYSAYMSITINLPAFAVYSFDLELPWSDPSISLLEDPNETGDAHGEYCFLGESLYKFHRSLVINHYADLTRLLSRGRTLEGFLLWGGMNPIPEDWPHWKKIPAFVIVYDQWSSTYRYPITLMNTCDKKSFPHKRRKSARKRLFECRDPEHGTPVDDNALDRSTPGV